MTRHQPSLTGSPPTESLADSLVSAASGYSYDGRDCCSFGHPAIIPIHQPSGMPKEQTYDQLPSVDQQAQLPDPTLLQECQQ